MGGNRWTTTGGGAASGKDGVRSEDAVPTGAADGCNGTGGAAAGTGDGAAKIRFGGAATDEQEQEMLLAEAVHALEQSRIKFAEAEKGPNTDNAALLYAHQCALAKIGTPSTLAEVHAFERWRKALGENLEKVAADRLREEGAYW